jgi:hypothetical protein
LNERLLIGRGAAQQLYGSVFEIDRLTGVEE